MFYCTSGLSSSTFSGLEPNQDGQIVLIMVPCNIDVIKKIYILKLEIIDVLVTAENSLTLSHTFKLYDHHMTIRWYRQAKCQSTRMPGLLFAFLLVRMLFIVLCKIVLYDEAWVSIESFIHNCTPALYPGASQRIMGQKCWAFPCAFGRQPPKMPWSAWVRGRKDGKSGAPPVQ